MLRVIASILCFSLYASSAWGAEARTDAPVARINLTPGAAPASPELVAELAEHDRRLFDAVFGCKLDALAALVADDFEFVHDKHGLTADSGAKFMDGMRANCAAQATGDNFRARRELVEGSMSVHVLNHYGAMQMGEHRFFALQPGQSDRLTETGHFINLWRRIDGAWKLSRVISYDHRLAE
ncbi:MAG: nuclear transport factor 2 family protein [Lysobacter sp.]|nr:nuclear transport factor 2 family protein [Lysobacter sp.]